MTIKINNMQYHRNGICGEPFYVFSFYCNKQKFDMIGVVFGKFNRQEIFELDSNPKVAIFKSKLLGENNINFGENSFRGDHYSDYFKKYINNRKTA